MPKYCCPALELALGRANDNTRTGIRTGTVFKPTGNRLTARTVVVIYFPKAKKGDDSKYGFNSEYKDTVYGLCRFCPFCGAALEKKEKKSNVKKKAGTVAADHEE